MRRNYTYFLNLFFIGALSLQANPLSWDRTEAAVELAPDATEASASYIATNNSDAVIQISKIETSCGCTGSVVDKKRLHPGESTKVVASFHKGKRTSGGTNKLQVFLDDATQPSATLKLKVEIATPIRVNPQIVYWNASSAATERSVQVTLDLRYASELAAIEYDSESMTVTRESNSEDPSLLTLSILTKSFDTALRQSIILRSKPTKDQSSAEAKIHVFVQK